MQNPLLVKIEAIQLNLSIESNRLTKNLLYRWEAYRQDLNSKSQLWLNQLLEKRLLKNTVQPSVSSTMTPTDVPVATIFQQLESKLVYFQQELRKLSANTLEEINLQRNRLQALIEEIIDFLDDLIAPLTDKNPFFVEDFMIFLDSLKLELNGLRLDLQTNLFLPTLNTFTQSTRLNEQLIEVRHRIEKQKDILLDMPTKAYEQITATLELIEQDFKRLFM